MKILVCSPCYAGLMSQYYFMSFFRTIGETSKLGWQVGSFTLGNESLIARGRNTCAGHFLRTDKEPQWDKLLFIDADITWTPDDFVRVVTSSKYIVGAAVPLKKYPYTLSFNVYPEDEKFFDGEKRSPEGYWAMGDAHGNQDMPVRHLGSAFMCIDRYVLESLKSKVKSYIDTTGPEPIECWDFFGTGVSDEDGTYHSEDWHFCALAAKNGFKTHLVSDCILAHTGTHTFTVPKRKRQNEAPAS